MKTVLKIVAVVVVLLIVAVGLGVYLYGNTAIQRVVEQQGTKATGVETQLAGVALNPFGGALSLNGFTLANPQGFTDAKIFELNEANVEVKIGTLPVPVIGNRGDEIVVPEVNVDGAVVLVELSNLKLNSIELLKQIQKQGESEDAGPEGEEPEADPGEAGESKPFVINNLNITNTKVIGRIAVPGVGEQDINLELADIRKTDVRGVELSDVIAFTLETILLNASQTLSQNLPNFDQLAGQLTDISGQVLDDIGGELDKVAPGVGGVARELGGAEVDKAIGGLLGGDKEKDAQNSDAAEGETQEDSDVGSAIREGIGGLLGGGSKDESSSE
ncbi:MAG: hypothetical protein AAFX76_05160 [Planctomycetota bacterium]